MNGATANRRRCYWCGSRDSILEPLKAQFGTVVARSEWCVDREACAQRRLLSEVATGGR